MPPNPYSWDELEDLLAWARKEGLSSQETAPLAWVQGDQEYYPVWSTTLYEQDQIWSTKFGLRTSEQRIERLAQEAALYVICMGLASES